MKVCMIHPSIPDPDQIDGYKVHTPCGVHMYKSASCLWEHSVYLYGIGEEKSKVKADNALVILIIYYPVLAEGIHHLLPSTLI